MKYFALSCIYLALCGFLNPFDKDVLYPPFLKGKSPWADSVFASLTPDERIGQLFMVAAFSNQDQQHVKEITELIQVQKIGGLIFFQGGPVRQALLTNNYQCISKVPLMIAMDAEWGLGMRIDSAMSFPYQMALGAMQNNKLIYEMGFMIAKQCKRLGVHINLAPVVDINNNPNNPVINQRSFGENKENVALKGIAYMNGMQNNGVLANAKHFPGHGDTDTDSHLALPVISHSKERLDSMELYPFKKLIQQGLGSVMAAHLYHTAYENEPNTASTLSKSIITRLLKDSLGFKGLVFTDALIMKGVSDYFEPGILEVKALLAGNDVLLYPKDVPKAIEEIKKAIESGQITQEEIDLRCKKILRVKEWLGLNKLQDVKYENLYHDLNSKQGELLYRKLMESALTVIENKNNIIPLRRLDTLKIATLSVGKATGITAFQEMLNNYSYMDHFTLNDLTDSGQISAVIEQMPKYNLVMLSLHSDKITRYGNFGISPKTDTLLKRISAVTKVILTSFSNPYGLSALQNLENSEAILIAYNNTGVTQELAAQLIFGGVAANGSLPVSISKKYPAGTGLDTKGPFRLKYTIPEEVQIASSDLDTIDSIALNAIKEGAAPGCQIFIAKEGKVIYKKSYGSHTYGDEVPVKNTDLYDLASITKIPATTLAVMKLYDKKNIDLDKPLGHYLPELRHSNKKKIVIRNMMAHQARLQSFLPFWLETVENVSFDKKSDRYITAFPKYAAGFYSTTRSDLFPTRVAEGLYIRKGYDDIIMQKIIDSKLRKKKEYYYSDLGYYFLLKIIQQISGETIEDYTAGNFYAPLGLSTMGYRPRERFNLERIIPTEDDSAFRRQLVHGDVHDPGAAMMGGVSGHAGLFSNANDLGILMQMMLQGGSYGGDNYIKSSTIEEFTKCQFCDNDNRRGAWFDRPEMDYTKEGPTCRCISANSFGHTGFTGTMAWADTEKQLVYIFLSNRVNPDAQNKKLVTMNVRTDIMQAIYDAVRKGEKEGAGVEK